MTVQLTGWSKFDSVLVGILVFSLILSAVKGLTRELVSIGALVWGFLFAAWFYQDASSGFLPYAKNAEVASFTAFALIFLLCLFTGGFLSRLAGGAVDRAGLRWVDRMLGASFGLLRGILLVLVLILALTAFDLGKQPLAHSRLAPYFMDGARVMVSMSPADMQDRFRRGYARVRKAWTGRPKHIKGDLS